MSDNLREWITEQAAARNWTMREVGRRGGLPHSTVSRIMQPSMSAGLVTCKGLARAFGAPLALVLELAGHLPRTPEDNHDLQVLRAAYYALDADQRSQLVQYAQFLRSGPKLGN